MATLAHIRINSLINSTFQCLLTVKLYQTFSFNETMDHKSILLTFKYVICIDSLSYFTLLSST